MSSQPNAVTSWTSLQPIPSFDQHVLWSYGTGNAGVRDGELFGPHSAEQDPFDPDLIVVAEQYGCDILLISQSTGKLRVLYGERGVAGSGDRLNALHSAHYVPSGPYGGHVLITEFWGENRVMILDRDTGTPRWCCAQFERPLDAIHWDDEHLMVSDCKRGIFKVRLDTQATVWHYDSEPHGHPFYLQKLSRDFCDSYGGDLLIGYWGPNRVVREIDTTTKETVWLYGGGEELGRGDLYDQLNCPVRALRYGIQELGGGLTVICDERSRILCVNREKELVWELGGASGENLMTATPYALQPTYVHVTRRGTLLVTDWGRNAIYEMDPFCIPARAVKDAYLFLDYTTTSEFADSAIMESRGYRDKNLQLYSADESGGLNWRILGSHNAKDWQTVHSPAAVLGAGQSTHVLIEGPWNFIKAQARSAGNGVPARVSVFITMQR